MMHTIINNQPVARPIRYRTGIASVILHTRLVLEPTATTEKITSLFWNRQRYVSLSRSIGRLWDTVTPTYVVNKKGSVKRRTKLLWDVSCYSLRIINNILLRGNHYNSWTMVCRCGCLYPMDGVPGIVTAPPS